MRTTIKIDQIDDQRAPSLFHDDSSSTDSGDEPHVDESQRCKYPSKFCGRARVRKSNGTHHRFCQFHRIRANANQKRWTSVRRQQTTMEQQQYRHRAEAVATLHALPASKCDNEYPHWQLPDPIGLELRFEPTGLLLEDLEILHALFGDAPPLETASQGPWYVALHALHKPQFDIGCSYISL